MRKIRNLVRGFFDVRAGELPRTLLMALYLFLLLFAYYILKPVSRAMFLNKFEIDKLPWLFILIAGVGGLLAYLYTKVAVRSSLEAAVGWATLVAAVCLVALWWLLHYNLPWMLYVFNIWVSLFGIVLVSQAWLLAANVFDSREAKRLYGILGLGALIGAALGGLFAAAVVDEIGVRNLLLASAAVVALSYAVFRFVRVQKGVQLSAAKGAEDEDSFTFFEMIGAIGRHRHLQVIIAIMGLTYMVDVLIEYQFSAMAKAAFPDREQLTAFLGNFFGLYLNLAQFVFQFFLMAWVVGRVGVGGTLQIMPVTVGIASIATYFSPGLVAAAITRLTEASTRYSFNRTAMELLYLPLPVELKNRTKAFVDIFADRLARGIGGLLLVLLTTVIGLPPRAVSLAAAGLAVIWVLLNLRARDEYVATVRKRIEIRRLDLESARVSVRDPATLRLLERTARSPNARQAAYALSLLGEVEAYDPSGLLQELAGSPWPEVRGKAFELACARGVQGMLEPALAELRSSRAGAVSPAIRPAVACALRLSPERRDLARRLLDHPNSEVVGGAIESLAGQPDLAQDLVTHGWLAAAARDPNPARRRLAAAAIRIRGDAGTEALYQLLSDPSPEVAAEACRAAGALGNRGYVPVLVERLANVRVRGAAIEALAAYGIRIAGTLGDLLADETVPEAIRRQVPRVLKRIPHQRTVDLLLGSLNEPNLTIRTAVLRALGRLRETAPSLDYGVRSVNLQILNEARGYFELSAALEPFRDSRSPHTAANLLARTLEHRLQAALERLFSLLGLRYPPKQIYAAYLAVNRRKPQEYAAALEFLDNVLDRELKRYLLPLLDQGGQAPAGRELFGVEEKTADQAIAELIRSGDTWLVACAMATAAELKLKRMAPDIAAVSERAGFEVAAVARAALAALA